MSRRTRVAGILVVLFLTLNPFAALAASADAPLPITGVANKTLVGNSAGAVDSYAFTMPGAVAAPTITVTFTPSAAVDTNAAGFVVLLNGTQVGVGQITTTHGVLTYTLPANPSGVVLVQVYSYAPSPASFTIQTANVPGNIPNGPAVNNATADHAAWSNGTLTESLTGGGGGSFAYFTFPSPGSSPPATVTLTYSPADAQVNQAVGFNVYDEYANTIGSASQPANQNLASATLSVNLSRTPGEPLGIQVYNYAPGVTITYQLSVTGIAPAVSPPAPAPVSPPMTALSGFQPFWVENFVVTPIWSGVDANAVRFGNQRQFSHFLVVQPQSGSRLYVRNPATNNYGYIDASAVGPSGPPGS